MDNGIEPVKKQLSPLGSTGQKALGNRGRGVLEERGWLRTYL
jgi:hypothetical protein